jgi:hypothetical protein
VNETMNEYKTRFINRELEKQKNYIDEILATIRIPDTDEGYVLSNLKAISENVLFIRKKYRLVNSY